MCGSEASHASRAGFTDVKILGGNRAAMEAFNYILSRFNNFFSFECFYNLLQEKKKIK